ncbi:MAG TPA: hypothetical protein DHW42_08365 [Candidatus Marinimicrobia bacterium]|nr:hypothetical protein [Candidatus Neomarinimicrobiota bacterium]
MYELYGLDIITDLSENTLPIIEYNSHEIDQKTLGGKSNRHWGNTLPMLGKRKSILGKTPQSGAKDNPCWGNIPPNREKNNQYNMADFLNRELNNLDLGINYTLQIGKNC